MMSVCLVKEQRGSVELAMVSSFEQTLTVRYRVGVRVLTWGRGEKQQKWVARERNAALPVHVVEYRTTRPHSFLRESDKWRSGAVCTCASQSVAPDPVFVGGKDERRRTLPLRSEASHRYQVHYQVTHSLVQTL